MFPFLASSNSKLLKVEFQSKGFCVGLNITDGENCVFNLKDVIKPRQYFGAHSEGQGLCLLWVRMPRCNRSAQAKGEPNVPTAPLMDTGAPVQATPRRDLAGGKPPQGEGTFVSLLQGTPQLLQWVNLELIHGASLHSSMLVDWTSEGR